MLDQNKRILELVKQCADQMSAAGNGTRQEPCDPSSAGKFASTSTETVVRDLRDATEQLVALNKMVQVEIRDRTMVDHQLAAALEQEQGSRNAALHDSLTGLPNRVLFKDRLMHGIAQAKRHDWMFAVMFVDLDKFKSVNDTYGHHVGDAVLQAVAMRFKRIVRDDDTVSRYGGDEFLCLLTHLHDRKDIAMIAAKLLKAIRAPCQVTMSDVIINPCIGASIGIAVYPWNGGTVSSLINSADEAMYAAKKCQSGYAFA